MTTAMEPWAFGNASPLIARDKQPMVAVIDASSTRSAWIEALSERVQVQVVDDAAGVLAVSQSPLVDLVILPISHADEERTLRTLSVLISTHSGIPILGYVPRTADPRVLTVLPTLVRAGLTRMAIEGQDDIDVVVMDSIRQCRQGGDLIRFDTEIARIPSRIVQNFCYACFTPEANAGVVDAVARRSGSTLRHITRELTGLAMSTPRALLLSIRVYRTWHAVMRGAQPRKAAYHTFYWTSEDALRKALVRLNGMPVSSFYLPQAEIVLVTMIQRFLHPYPFKRR